MNNTDQKYKPLLDLSKSKDLHNGDFDAFIKSAMSTLGHELNVSRSSFWIFDQKKKTIENMGLYQLSTGDFISGDVLHNDDFPSYFNAFQKSLIIDAVDARTDPRTSEFKDSYLDPKNIKSMLDAQVWVSGKLFGVICLEHIDKKKHWEKKDEIYITTAASYISQAYLTKLRVKEEKLRRLTETNYQKLFSDSPVSMWVYDPNNFNILDVNNEAIAQYGYNKKEFVNLSLFDILPEDEIQALKSYLKKDQGTDWEKGEWKHRRKDGSELTVRVSSDWTTFMRKKARIAMSIDITFEKKMQQERQELITQLSDYAFFASHNLRGPVSSIMGLIDLVDEDVKKGNNFDDTLSLLKQSSIKLDNIIREMHRQLE